MKKPAAKSSAPERRSRLKRRAEDQLPDFRDLIENSVQAVLVHRNFKPLYANHACAELFGYKSPKEIMALPLLRPLVPADMWARVEAEYDDLIHGRRKSVVTRARAIRRDGHEIWTAATERVIDWHGDPAVQINAHDITEQMAVEQTLLKNEQHLRAILEILPYPIYISRREDGHLLFVNRKTCLLFQQSAGQLLKGASTNFFVNANEREEMRKLLDTIPDIRDVEVNMKTAQGREFMAEVAAIGMDYGKTPAVLVALNDISQRKEMEAELFRQASTDSLTGISNRRYFMAQAEQELRRSRRFARTLSVMMIDIDYFKSINDKHGHSIGDAILQGVVKRALESLRQSDFLGRLGGEEFAVILPETDLAAAALGAERLRQHIAERPIIAEREAIPCTVSVGVAQLSAKDSSIDALLNHADAALYRAKHNGRNKVELAEWNPGPSHLRAIGFAIAGFAIWVLSDSCMKMAGEAALPPYEMVAFLGLFGFLIMGAKGCAQGNLKTLWPRSIKAQSGRAALAVTTNIFNAIALKHLPLTMFYVAVFTAPLMIAILAAFFLKEHLTWQKSLAVITGFLGVVVAIDPMQDFSHGDWIGYGAALTSAVCFAMSVIWLRKITQRESGESLVFFTAFVEMFFGFIVMLWHADPLTPRLLLLLFAMGSLCVFGNLAIYSALKHTTAANVSQFHYTQIITGALLGYLIWNEIPTAHLLVGITVVIGSGLYIATHARKSANLAALAQH